MAGEPMTIIKLDPDSELAHVLAEKDAGTVVLESMGVRYTVTRDDEDPWANYDPAKLREALYEAAGMITPEEGERMKELVYRGREEGTRPPGRP